MKGFTLSLDREIELLQSEHFDNRISNTKVYGLSYDKFFEENISEIDKEGNFIFLDPPYDSVFNDYDDQGAFTHDDHRKLKDILMNIKRAKWMLVIGSTEFIDSLYKPIDGKMWVESYGKRYSIQTETPNAIHLVVTNYPIDKDGVAE